MITPLTVGLLDRNQIKRTYENTNTLFHYVVFEHKSDIFFSMIVWLGRKKPRHLPAFCPQLRLSGIPRLDSTWLSESHLLNTVSHYIAGLHCLSLIIVSQTHLSQSTQQQPSPCPPKPTFSSITSTASLSCQARSLSLQEVPEV